MPTYISELEVSLDGADENKLKSQGFEKVNVNLDEGVGQDNIFLWYKIGSVPITRVQVTFNYEMGVGLETARYTKITKDLNYGAEGDPIYLWYFKGHTAYDAPIVEIDVTNNAESEAKKMADNWERLATNLNRGAGGKLIHAWVKREKQTYICDVNATDSHASDTNYLKDGYIRVDEDTNSGAGGAPVFIWYRQTTDSKDALNLLQVSTNDSQYQSLQQQNYTRVKVNLNEGTKGNQVYLWHKKDGSNNPIKAIALLLNKDVAREFSKAGLNVIKRNLNEGNQGNAVYLCVNQ